MTFPVASRWCCHCETILQCRRVQGGTVVKREKFGADQTMYTEVITGVLLRRLKLICLHGTGLATPFNLYKTIRSFFIVEGFRTGSPSLTGIKYTACKLRKMAKNCFKFHLKCKMAVFLLGLGFGSTDFFVHLYRFYVPTIFHACRSKLKVINLS